MPVLRAGVCSIARHSIECRAFIVTQIVSSPKLKDMIYGDFNKVAKAWAAGIKANSPSVWTDGNIISYNKAILAEKKGKRKIFYNATTYKGRRITDAQRAVYRCLAKLSQKAEITLLFNVKYGQTRLS